MLKYLFIAEKPSVMNAVKDTYHRHKADIANKIGEIEFTALSGQFLRWFTLFLYREYSFGDHTSIQCRFHHLHSSPAYYHSFPPLL